MAAMAAAIERWRRHAARLRALTMVAGVAFRWASAPAPMLLETSWEV